MSLARHLEEATRRMHEAFRRVETAREQPASMESTREWLEGLTDYCQALCDVHTYNNESVHEKLQEIAGRARVVTKRTHDVRAK